MLDEQCLITFGSGIPSTHPQSSLRQATNIMPLLFIIAAANDD
jgi:hypothetical protein